MGSHSEEPVTGLPTRRSLREAERRSAAQSESAPVPATAAPRIDPDSPTAVHHVPSWAHTAPVAPPTEALARVAQAPVVRPQGSPATSQRPVPQPAVAGSAVPRTSVPQSSVAPQPTWSAVRPSPSDPVTQPRATWSVAQDVAAAPAAPAAEPVALPTLPVVLPALPVAEPVALPTLPAVLPALPAAEPVVEAAVEVAPVAHGTVRRRSGRPTRTAARLGVLGVLAGITVVIPVSQGVVPGPVAFGSDALADSTLPSTVSALAGSPLSALPPSSLVSADGALQARSLSASSRTEERSLLPGCDGSVRPAGQNGLLKVSDLCTLWDNHTQLRADAAVSLAEFNQAFAARFGSDLCLSSGYRTLAQQRAVKAQKGGLAAAPGKSNHGWGLAVDLCQDQTSGVKWKWINDNGPTYGWQNPAWALPGGSGPHEKWHWEYAKGVQADGEYYDG